MRERYPEGKILSALKERSADHRVYYLALQRQIILCLIETFTSELYLIVSSGSLAEIRRQKKDLPCSRLATKLPQTPPPSEKSDKPEPSPSPPAGTTVDPELRVGWPEALSRVDERSWPVNSLRMILKHIWDKFELTAFEDQGSKSGTTSPSEPDHPSQFYTNNDPIQPASLARLYLFHTGLLNPQQLSSPHVRLIEEKPNLRRYLEELDTMPARPCLTVVTMFQTNRQDSFLAALKNEGVLSNVGFRNFVTGLGNRIVDTSVFGGWTGLKNTRHNLRFPHYSDTHLEMSFVLPNLIPSDTRAKFSQSDLLTDITWAYPSSLRSCFLIWSEDPASLNIPKIFGEIQMIFGLSQNSTAVIVISRIPAVSNVAGVSSVRFSSSLCVSIYLGGKHQLPPISCLQGSELANRIRGLCCEYSRLKLTAEKDRAAFIHHKIVGKFSSLQSDAVLEALFV
eukprot:sb/3464584/